MVAKSKKHCRRIARSFFSTNVPEFVLQPPTPNRTPEYVSVTSEKGSLLIHLVPKEIY